MDLLKKILPKIKNALTFSLIAIFASLGLGVPLPSSAGLVTSAILALPGIFLVIIGFFANLFAQVSGALFNWVTGPNFIKWSYTQNPVVEMGLGITKQFVNMGLVVVLIFIALAITLRLKEYASQKTLIRLIAVALLVNFAPVICGLIIDAANIFMNYFLSTIREGVAEILGGFQESVTTFTRILSLKRTSEEQLSLFAKLGVDVTFNFIIGFTFLLLTVIFVARYIAIWILVILAPLAFVAWILPTTKKFWDQWWQQFLQWSIIGIPMAFFLYLAMNSFTAININFTARITGIVAAQEGGSVGMFDMVLPYMMVIIMIWLGIIIGLQTSAMGASGIINFAKTKGKTGAKWAAKAIPAGTAAATAGAFRGFGKGAKEGKGLGRITGAAKGAFMGAASYEGREKGREVMGRALEKAHLVRPGAYEADRRKRWKIEEEVKRLDSLPTDRLHDVAQRAPITPADRKGAIAAFEVLAKRGELGDKEKGLLPKMQSFGADTKQILKARPDWGSEVGKTAEDIKKQIEGTAPGDFTKNTQAEALKDIEVARHLDAAKIKHIGIRGSSQQKKAIADDAAPKLKSRIQELSKKSKTTTLSKEEQGEWLNLILVLNEIKLNPNFY